MLKLASALFSYEFCNKFSTESFNQYILPQLAYEPTESSTFFLNQVLLIILFACFGSCGLMVAFNKTKAQTSTEEQKKKPPESVEREYNLARIITSNKNHTESKLRQPQAKGWHGRLPLPLESKDYPVDESHRKARRLAYEKHHKTNTSQASCDDGTQKGLLKQSAIESFGKHSRRVSFTEFEDFPKCKNNLPFLHHLTLKI